MKLMNVSYEINLKFEKLFFDNLTNFFFIIPPPPVVFSHNIANHKII